MHRLLTAEEAGNLDRYTIDEIGVPSVVLMERAAEAVSQECIREAAPNGKILCVCAVGNNGADGAAAARILFLKGLDVSILLAGDERKASEEMKLQLQIARNLRIPVSKADERGEYIKPGEYAVIADALFGVGLKRPLEGVYAELVRQINESGAKVIAVDLPSGVRADDGSILGCAVRADVTVTFGTEKLGMILYPGTEYCGRRVMADIGLAERQYEAARQDKSPAFTYDSEDTKRLPARPAYSNKGTFGRVLVIAGSPEMGGAALFCGMAAYRMGAGLVEIATPKQNRNLMLDSLPEAVLTIYDPQDDPDRWLPEAAHRAKAIVAGPGMGTSQHTEKVLRFLLERTETPLVLDADALNVLAASENLTGLLSRRVILTPHLGEMSRLTGKTVRELQKNLIRSAAEYSRKTGAVCVMKDARTVVSSPEGKTYINTSGNCGMATGGSGDLLAGMLGALLAEGMDPFEGACLGVYLHGLYGDKAAGRYGVRTMIASDMAAIIGGEQ